MRLDTSNRRRGSTFLEFTLVGIPIMLLLMTTVELARGMWTYNTLSHALRDATRYVIVHGNNCASYPNRCTVQIQNIAQKLQFAGLGLDADSLRDIQFISSTRTVTCATLSACLSGCDVLAHIRSMFCVTLSEPGLRGDALARS